MATALGISAILLWGILALLGTMTTSLPAFKLLFICFAISALIMFARRMIRGERILRRPNLPLRSWLIGITGLFGFHFFYFMALRQAPALEVSLIVYLWPLLLAVLVAHSDQRLRALLGGLVGFIGIVVLMSGKGELTLSGDSTLGYLLAILCALIWSNYSAYLARSPGKVDDIGWISLAVAGLSLLAHLILESNFSLDASLWQFSSSEWLGAILLGLGPVGGAFYLWDIGLKQGNKTLLASLSFFAPLISSVALVVAGQDKPSVELLISVGLIMLGGLIANRNSQKPRTKTLDNTTP
ncbi:EamA family transporter [Pontibacterium granulatum]|uniref:DMT family transporter n=1 Tax=Pontibacterium granulatum TaxID=2036029 RepID=UPI00249AD07F|nr:EamA family transporter [Pontibacterium granulatum]MDI3323905.1 EamA family transporter [Pontibacterium granulatum]